MIFTQGILILSVTVAVGLICVISGIIMMIRMINKRVGSVNEFMFAFAAATLETFICGKCVFDAHDVAALTVDPTGSTVVYGHVAGDRAVHGQLDVHVWRNVAAPDAM